MMFDNIHVHMSHSVFTIDFTYPTLDGQRLNRCRATIPCGEENLDENYNQPMLPFPGVYTRNATETNNTAANTSTSGHKDTLDRLLENIAESLPQGKNFLDSLVVAPENVFLAQLFTAVAHTRIVQRTGNIGDSAIVCGWECVAARKLGIWWHFASPKHVGALYGVGDIPIRKWTVWETDNFPDVAQEEGKIFLNPQKHFLHTLSEYNTTVRCNPGQHRELTINDFPSDAYQCLLTAKYLRAATAVLGDDCDSLTQIVKLKRANVLFP